MAVGHAGAWIEPSYYETVFASGGNFGLAAAPGGRLEHCDGGYTLAGEWPLVTGVLDANWAGLNCLLRPAGSDHPQLRMVIVETADLEVDPVWNDAAAMKGTGSHRVTVESLFVPEGLVVDLLSPSRLDRSRYRPGNLVSIGGIGNSAVPVGILQAALDTVAEELKHKVSTISGMASATSGGVLELLADARMTLWNLRAGAMAAADRYHNVTERNEEISADLRAVLIGTQFEAGRIARQTISDLYARSSRAAFFNGHNLERSLRDIHAVAYASETLRPLQHDIGRITLGLKPHIPAA